MFDGGDLILLTALALVGYGLAQWSIGLACVVEGAILLALAWPSAESRPSRRDG